MEDPQERVICPDCEGSGLKEIFDWETGREGIDECPLCLGSGEISAADWGYYKDDKKESFKEDELKDLN